MSFLQLNSDLFMKKCKIFFVTYLNLNETMKNQIYISLIVLIMLSSCVDDKDCVMCEKNVWPGSGKVLATLACSEEEVQEIRKDGYKCPHYTSSNFIKKSGSIAGHRIVYLTSPVDKSLYVSDTLLIWSDCINWHNDDFDYEYEVTYDVYFGTETTPTNVVSKGQKAIIYAPILNKGTTYYWKVVAENLYGDTSESEVWSFTTRP